MSWKTTISTEDFTINVVWIRSRSNYPQAIANFNKNPVLDGYQPSIWIMDSVLSEG